MSAAIVKKYFKGDIDLLPYNYGKEIPDVNKYDKVFVVDVSFGSRTRFLFDEWKEKGIDVVWIDHHKTAIDDMRDYEVKGKRRIGTAACELTWEGPGVQRCAICGITKQSEWRDGKTSNCVYLSSGELYSMTGETPECRDLSEFY